MSLALDIKGLHKVYKSGTVALSGIDLQVNQGDFFALLGPNGAGKSTTIGIISSLVNKSQGSIKVFDYDIDTQLEAAKSQLGLVPQEFNFNQFETVLQIVVNQAGYYGVPKSLALVRAETARQPDRGRAAAAADPGRARPHPLPRGRRPAGDRTCRALLLGL